jgi:hypothetical protein
VSWSAKRSERLADSTTVAEYYALNEAQKEARFTRDVLEFFAEPQTTPTPIYTDSTGARAVATNPGSNHARLRHLKIADHQIQQEVEAGTIVVHRVNTEDNVADIFTKALPKERHQKLTELLGLRTLPPSLALAARRPKGSVGMRTAFHQAEKAKFGHMGAPGLNRPDAAP